MLKDLLTRRAVLGDTDDSIDALEQDISNALNELYLIEPYWAFPGRNTILRLQAFFESKNWWQFSEEVSLIARAISTDSYRSCYSDFLHLSIRPDASVALSTTDQVTPILENKIQRNKQYIELLVVDALDVQSYQQVHDLHANQFDGDEDYICNIFIASTFEDALISVLLNYTIQACVIRYSFPFDSHNSLNVVPDCIEKLGHSIDQIRHSSGPSRSAFLAAAIRNVRPELPLYLLSEASVETVNNNHHELFDRCFFGSEDYLELRLSIMKSLHQRFNTPFFDALKKYASRPTGVFHALPISRGKSISKSHWIRDYGSFYGDQLFLSETSATTGGLDSLHDPSGSLLQSQRSAAKVFGSHRSMFFTNGTSTANKVVLQALTSESDIILVSSDCHKSHHHASILCGVEVVLLPVYRIDECGISGGVPLEEIKRCLLECEKASVLHRVRCIVLTNLTFDGISCNLQQVFRECIAIKPDIIFIIDEAWFAYGRATPLTRGRTAMSAAESVRRALADHAYRTKYQCWLERTGGRQAMTSDEQINSELLPEPGLSKVRVYSTQSTHKTLTALRQASMLHISDDLYSQSIHRSFSHAFQCHTSTSPNYQILASLDIATRQLDFEGYELVQKAYELSLVFREGVNGDPYISKVFKALEVEDLIPSRYRASLSPSVVSDSFWRDLDKSWTEDDFSLDPSRVTLQILDRRLNGFALKSYLMDRYDIQVNKTSRNSILVVMHIGATRGMVTYLLNALKEVSKVLINDQNNRSFVSDGLPLLLAPPSDNAVPLPQASSFHSCFVVPIGNHYGSGDIRKAYMAAKKPLSTELIHLKDLMPRLSSRQIACASMVTPYPPGYPLLLPGQLVTIQAVEYLASIAGEEVHGFNIEDGLLIFREDFLLSLSS